MANTHKYVAFLRGINVGGHHKVPMAELREILEKAGFRSVQTLLNSGNIIFETETKKETVLEEEIGKLLEKSFNFSIPTLVRKHKDIEELITSNPFKNIAVDKNIRLYVTFLKKMPGHPPSLPWSSEDDAAKIIDQSKGMICSVADISRTKSPEAMKVLQDFYGKNITTRNWNTILKISKKA